MIQVPGGAFNLSFSGSFSQKQNELSLDQMLTNLKNDVTQDVPMNPVSFELQSQEYFQTRMPVNTPTPLVKPLETLMQSRVDERASLLPPSSFADTLGQSANYQKQHAQAQK